MVLVELIGIVLAGAPRLRSEPELAIGWVALLVLGWVAVVTVAAVALRRVLPGRVRLFGAACAVALFVLLFIPR